jgi:hypothetical protein
MRACYAVVLIATAVIAAGGCGDDGVNIDTSADNVCGTIAAVACHNIYDCCTEHEIETFLHVTERQDEDQCKADVQRSCERNEAVLKESLDKKRVKFDANIMNNCLAAVEAPSGTCSEVLEQATLPYQDACMRTAWVGLVPADGECQNSYECAGSPDAYCSATQTCVARPGHGEPCASGCSHEFYCALNICQPKLPVGASCAAGGVCEDKLFCDTTQTMPTCIEPLAAGSACTTSAACESKDCLPGTCAGTTSTCYKDTDCGGRCADDGSFCSNSGNCAIGTCQMTGFSCSTPTQCGTGDTCVFPVACILGDCIGDPVCSTPRVVVDYCDAATSEFSVIP